MPMMPRKLPITVIVMTIKSGFIFVTLLIIKGFIRFDSTSWHTRTIATAIIPSLILEANPMRTAGAPPIYGPTKGIIFVIAINREISIAYLNPNTVKKTSLMYLIVSP